MADDIGKNFSNLPLESLIAAPLIAAANANAVLAKATYEFIENVWLEKGKGGGGSGQTPPPRILKFKLERPIDSGGVEEIEVNAPFAALVQLPNLMVRDIDIDFTMEVKNTSKDVTTVKAESSMTLGGAYKFYTAKLTGTVSTTAENTRTSDQSAKYTLNVKARQAEPTEGMNRLAQVFASVIDPRPTKG